MAVVSFREQILQNKEIESLLSSPSPTPILASSIYSSSKSTELWSIDIEHIFSLSLSRTLQILCNRIDWTIVPLICVRSDMSIVCDASIETSDRRKCEAPVNFSFPSFFQCHLVAFVCSFNGFNIETERKMVSWNLDQRLISSFFLFSVSFSSNRSWPLLHVHHCWITVMPILLKLVPSRTMMMIWSIMLIFFGKSSLVSLKTPKQRSLFVSSWRKHGRFMTKSGFVDSSRRIRSLQRQQDDLLVQHRTSPARGGLLAALNKSQFPSSSVPTMTMLEKKSKSFVGHELPSVISISTNLDTKQREHDKQMRLIEVNGLTTEIGKEGEKNCLPSFFRNKWFKPSRPNANRKDSKEMWRRNNGIFNTHWKNWIWVNNKSKNEDASNPWCHCHRYEQETIRCGEILVEESGRKRSNWTRLDEETRSGNWFHSQSMHSFLFVFSS